MRLSLVRNSESVGVDGEHQAFGSASDHDSEGGGHIKGAYTRMLVIAPTLIIIFPRLIEVEGVEKLDRPVKSRYDQANIFHVSQL